MTTSTFYPFLLIRNFKKTGLSGGLFTMKKLFLLISFAAPLLSIAQSTTILPGGIGIPKVTTLPACNVAEKGKQVFNSTINKMYYCNGTNWQEMTGGGFTIPYSKTANVEDNLLYLENTGEGRAIYGKSVSTTAIRGESPLGVAIAGTSDSSIGVYGSSISSSGLSGYSSSGSAGYFESDSTEPALYVTNAKGPAAQFIGNVKIANELTVDNNKGIVRSNNSTQQKIVRATISLNANIGAEGFIEGGTFNYEDFGGVPTVTVGQIINDSSTGPWHKALIIPINVTATECKFRIVNTSNSSISVSVTLQLLIVGPE